MMRWDYREAAVRIRYYLRYTGATWNLAPRLLEIHTVYIRTYR